MASVFVSYFREDRVLVDKLCQKLEAHNVNIWLDRKKIQPGAYWKDAIREAIEKGDFFIACFSQEINRRNKSYLYKELDLAIEIFNQLKPGRLWFIPVKLTPCKIPKIQISSNKTILDLQWVDLYADFEEGSQQIIRVIHSDLQKNSPKGKQESTSQFSEISRIPPDNNLVPEILVTRNKEQQRVKIIKELRNFLLQDKNINDEIIMYIIGDKNKIIYPDDPQASWKTHIKNADIKELKRILSDLAYNFGSHPNTKYIESSLEKIALVAGRGNTKSIINR